MIRRVLFVLLLVVFACAISYSYLYFKEKKQPLSNTLSAIPKSAAFIIESNNAVDSWGKLSSSNIIWSELMETSLFGEINETIEHIDSLRLVNQEINNLIQNRSIFISAHMSGANSFDYLFSVGISNTLTQEQIHDFVLKELKIGSLSNKIYDGANIYSGIFGSTKVSYAVYEGVFLISKSAILVEDAIRQINSKSSLLEVSSFKKIVKTAGKNIDANFYINYKVFPNIIALLVKENLKSDVTEFSDLASWTELDLLLKPNTIGLNGFTYSSDSINNYFNVFLDQSPVEQKVLKILPKNTAFLFSMGLSNLSKFQKRYKAYLEKNNQLFDFGSKILKMENEYNFSVEEDVFSWVGNEIALAFTESNNDDINNHYYAMIKANDIDFAIEKLSNIVAKVDQKKNTISDSTTFKGFTIRNLQIPEFLATTFNQAYGIIESPFYTAIDDYIVFANSNSAIREFINYNLNRNTLLKNEEFIQFYDNLSSESNLLVYSNVARSVNQYKSVLNDVFNDYLKEHEGLFRRFDGFAIQISKDRNNMYYNNVLLHYNPIYKKETSSLWEFKLDTTISKVPQIVNNHKTGAKDIVAIDDANTLYQISNTGKILWKKKLLEPVIGEIKQIDVFKNNKWQLLFNTASQLHLIDRNGNYVDNFPVDFTNSVQNSVSVMDYDENKNYRLLVVDSKGNIFNYDASGNLVKGWESMKVKADFDSEFKHFQLSGKDYIVGKDVEGNIYALDRRGKNRLSLKQQLIGVSNYYLVKKKTLSESFLITADSTGVIKKLFFGDSLNILSVPLKNQVKSFNYIDINNDNTKDYIFLTDENLMAYSQDLELIYNIEFEEELPKSMNAFDISNNTSCVGATLRNNEIHLYTSEGYDKSGFPLSGCTKFSMGDINKNGDVELVVGGEQGYIYVYTVEE